MTKYGIAIDTKRCMGCNMCSNVCRVDHNLPKDVLYSRALTEGGDFFRVPGGTYPNNLNIMFYTYSCQHCDNPACVEVCPTGASQKREDGIVWIDDSICIGCESCIAACPYEGVRTVLGEELEYYVDFTLGDQTVAAHAPHTVEKCTFCVERVDRGERPLCIDICPARARYWGDLDDPASEISQALAQRSYDQLKVEQGTGPNMYLLK